jgi:hypothetical protein
VTRVLRALALPGTGAQTLLTVAAILAGASLALLAIWWKQGETRPVSEPVPFEEYGAFDYSAALGHGIYDGDELRIPQPLFRRLGERLPVRYDYRVTSAAPTHELEGAHGSYLLTVELRQGNGWVRAFPFAQRTAFEGTSFSADGIVDLAAFAEIIKRLETDAGYKSAQYRVRLVADVQFEAVFAGWPVLRSHEQELDFVLTDVELRLDREGSGVAHAATGEVTVTSNVPRALTVPLLGLALPNRLIPGIATGGLGLALALVVLVLLVTWREAHRAVGLMIPSRYGDLIFDVDPFDPPPGRLVRVNTLPALLRLAGQYQAPVLRTGTGTAAAFWLLVDVTYVFSEFPVALPDITPQAGTMAPPLLAPVLPQAGLAFVAGLPRPPAPARLPVVADEGAHSGPPVEPIDLDAVEWQSRTREWAAYPWDGQTAVDAGEPSSLGVFAAGHEPGQGGSSAGIVDAAFEERTETPAELRSDGAARARHWVVPAADDEDEDSSLGLFAALRPRITSAEAAEVLPAPDGRVGPVFWGGLMPDDDLDDMA